MRGEVCIGAASFLSLASLVILIFVHVAQINTSSVPQGIYMVSVNASGYGAAQQAAMGVDPTRGLFSTNSSLGLNNHTGIRVRYRYGLYSHCASVAQNGTGAGIGETQCTNITAAYKYRPYEALAADVPNNSTIFLDSLIPNDLTSFRDSGTLGTFTEAAYYLTIIGTICVALAFVLGVLRYTYTFLLSTALAILASAMLLIAAAMWTAMINKSADIKDVVVPLGNGTHVPIGISVQMGDGLVLLWVAFAIILLSTLPYMISCCTYRG